MDDLHGGGGGGGRGLRRRAAAGGYGGAAEESYNGLFLARPDEAVARPPPVASVFCWRMSRGP